MLLDFLKTKNCTIEEAAKLLDVSVERFCRVMTNVITPSDDLQVRIDRLLAGERLRLMAVERFGSQGKAALELGISAPYFSQVCDGLRNPSLRLALQIEHLRGIYSRPYSRMAGTLEKSNGERNPRTIPRPSPGGARNGPAPTCASISTNPTCLSSMLTTSTARTVTTPWQRSSFCTTICPTR